MTTRICAERRTPIPERDKPAIERSSLLIKSRIIEAYEQAMHRLMIEQVRMPECILLSREQFRELTGNCAFNPFYEFSTITLEMDDGPLAFRMSYA